MISPKFNSDQIKALRSLGVVDPQIRRLGETLGACRTLLAPSAPMADVREELEALNESLAAAEMRMKRLLKGVGRQPATFEARVRIQLASLIDTGQAGPGNEVETALIATNAASAMVRRARDNLPTEQRRLLAACMIPVRLIYDALVAGWGEAYVPVCHDDIGPPTDSPRPFPIVVSSNPTGDFRAIVGICYDTFLETADSDPERAVKAFVRAHKAERKRLSSLATREEVSAK